MLSTPGKPMPGPVKIFFDGGCRTRAGLMEVAVVAGGRTTILPDLGPGTSNDAEWLALIHALTVAQAAGWDDVVLIGDSADVIAKARGDVKSLGTSAAHLATFRQLAAATRVRLRWVKRTQNLAGIALAGRRR